MSRRSSWSRPEGPFLLALLLSAPGVLRAGEARLRLELVVPVVQHLEVEPAVLSAPAVTSSDLAQGHLDLGRPIILTVFSNTAWELSIRHPAEPRGGPVAPEPPLLWSRGSPAFARLTDEWVPVASGNHGVAGMKVELRLRVPLDWTRIGPGTYEPRIEYKLAPSDL